MAVIKNGVSTMISPMDIKVYEEDNPRTFYGSGEDWESFKESIKDHGLEQNIKVSIDDNDEYFLVHGFRRMRAITEIFNEEEGVLPSKLEMITVDVLPNDKELHLSTHYRMNTGLDMNPVEKAEGLLRMEKLTGETNISELARKVNLSYNKTHMLLTFIKNAGSQVINAVRNGEISISNAYTNIIKKSASITEQNTILKESREKAVKNGDKKLVIKGSPKKDNDKKDSLQIKIGNFIASSIMNSEVNKDKLSNFKDLINAINNDQPMDQLIDLINGKK